MTSLRSRYLPAAVRLALVTGTVAAPAHAQVLEEVIVTATKRASGMQDVPIALSVMSGERITEQGIGNLSELSVFMPNVTITNGATTPNLYIRGIGSGVNDGFEQSVGTFIDGVYFGRAQAAETLFMDVERVEILKGSQSTLFGKNTIAGALNITNAKPTDEFEGIIDVSAEPEFDGLRGTVTLSGPITDNLGARLVVQAEESDGFMKNRFSGEDEMQQESQAARLTITWQPADELDATLKFETGKHDTLGTNQKITFAAENALRDYETADPNFAATLGTNYNKSDATIGAPRDGENSSSADWDIFTLTLDWALGDYSVRSITGYVESDSEFIRDADYSPLRGFNRETGEMHEQLTQEFLLTSPAGESFEYLLGLYYQDEDLELPRTTDGDLNALLLGGVPSSLNATGHNGLDQTSTTYSAFAQGTVHFNDAWRVIAGLRYSRDEKEFSKFATISPFLGELGDPPPDNIDTIVRFYDSLAGITVHEFADGVATICRTSLDDCEVSQINTDRSEDHVTGDLTLQWDASADTMIYAKYGNGYKAGGFDEDNSPALIDAQEFEDETSDTFEVGAKIDFLEGRGRFNVAVFYSEYDDVQVSTFDGTSGFIVGNAAKTQSSGIEMDAMFAVNDEITIYGALAILDAHYDDFKDGPCTTEQEQALEASGSTEACRQDLSGEPLQFAADYSGNVGATYSTFIGDSLELIAGADVLFTDDFNLASDGDENLVQDAYAKINARISLGSRDGRWTVALLGKNLTDETTAAWGSDIPFGSLGFAGSYWGVMEAPRSFEVQARFNF